MTAVAILLALTGACCYTVAAWLQHAATHEVPGRAAVLRELAGRPRWWAALAALSVGGLFHVTALQLAPVTVVQPLGVTSIVLTVLWGARARRAGLGRATVVALAGIVAGAGTFTTIAANVTVATEITGTAQVRVGLLITAVVAGCVLVARRAERSVRCLALAAGAGSAYGGMSVMIRATGEAAAAPGVGASVFGAAAGVALAALAGLMLVQRAQSAGPPEATVACLALADPSTAVAIGVVFLREAATLSLPTALAALTAWLVALTGVLHVTRATPFPV